MKISRTLYNCTALTFLLIVPVVVQAAEPLQPRAEMGVKAGTQRSILTTEFWAPLAQQSDRVVYTDMRLMGDDDDNREGNLGFGYRQMVPGYDNIIGAHAWIDRRRTDNNSTFHQVTLGVESLGKDIDARLNTYIPLNEGRTIQTGPVGTANPFLVGSGIFYNTNGAFEERPLYGTDAELGYRLPIFEKELDSIRVYGGGYSFYRNNSPSITGWRTRIVANITSDISVGGRFQHDNVAGDQAFAEATIRFPFKSKKSFRVDGVRSRLDESPERDVDIVTSHKVTAVSTAQQVLNAATGTAQRVVYVDNTAPAGGDGTKEHPYNNLTDAQNNLHSHDVLYIRSGDGTTTNMDQGITISQEDVFVIGSGSNFIYDNGRYTTSTGKNFNGFVLTAAGQAPNITNTQTSTDDFTGNGIFVTGSDVKIAGVNTSNAQGSGVFIYADNNPSFNNAFITNVTANNNAKYGIGVAVNNTSAANNITVSNSTANNNTQSGIYTAALGSNVNNILIDNNTTDGNQQDNIHVYAEDNGVSPSIGHVVLSNNNSTNSAGNGIYVDTFAQSNIGKVDVTNNVSSNNAGSGVEVQSKNNSTIGDVNVSSLEADGNTNYGLFLSNIGGSSTANITLNNIQANTNTNGIYIYSSSGGLPFGTVNASHLTTNSNTGDGFSILVDQGNGGVGNIAISDADSSHNGGKGLVVENYNSSVLHDITITNVTANYNQYGSYIYTHGGAQSGNVVLSNVTTSNNTADGNSYIQSSSNGGGNVTYTDVVSNNNAGRGISIFAESGGSLHNFTLTNGQTNSNGNDGTRVFIQNGGGELLHDLTITNLTSGSNTGSGLIVSSNFGAGMHDITLTTIRTSNNTVNGTFVGSVNASARNDITISDVISNTNGVNGFIISNAGGSVHNINVDNVTSNTNTGNGVVFEQATSTNANSVIFNHITTNTNTGNGIAINSYNGGTYASATYSNITSNYNTLNGIDYQVYNGGSFTGSTFTNVDASHNTGSGFNTHLYNGGNSSGLTITNSSLNNNGNSGLFGNIELGGQINNGHFTNVTANNNTGDGINFQIGNNGTLSNTQFTGNTASNNTVNGIELNATSGSNVAQDSLSNNNTINNGGTGLYIAEDTANTFGVDLGGGVTSSVGGNRSFGNGTADLLADVDGGVLSAQSNWWGDVTGLQPARVTLLDATTVDSTLFLSADPRP